MVLAAGHRDLLCLPEAAKIPENLIHAQQGAMRLDAATFHMGRRFRTKAALSVASVPPLLVGLPPRLDREEAQHRQAHEEYPQSDVAPFAGGACCSAFARQVLNS